MRNYLLVIAIIAIVFATFPVFASGGSEGVTTYSSGDDAAWGRADRQLTESSIRMNFSGRVYQEEINNQTLMTLSGSGLNFGYMYSTDDGILDIDFGVYEMEYDGELSDGTPYTGSGIYDVLFNPELMFGERKRFRGNGWTNSRGDFREAFSYLRGFVGFGYRYLFDGGGSMQYGYDREANQFSMPFGFQASRVDFKNGKKSMESISLIQGNLFLHGIQISHLSDLDPRYQDMENHQRMFNDNGLNGFGFELSQMVIIPGDVASIGLNIGLIAWSIGASEVSEVKLTNGTVIGEGYEPENSDLECYIGICLAW